MPTEKTIKDFPDADILVEAAVRMGEPLTKLIVPEDYSPRAQELKDWMDAVTYASAKLNPSRYLLSVFYRNLMNDTHLFSVLESRTLRVARSKFRVVNTQTKKENPELTAMLNAAWFEKYIRTVMSSVFFGTTIIEVFETNEEGSIKNVTMIPRGNVKPDKGVILKNYYDESGWDYKNPPLSAYYVQAGEDDDLGLIAKIGPMVIAKKFAIGAWSHYTEKFGIPFRWITTDSTDETRIKILNTILKLMAGAGYGVLQKGETLETLKTDSTHHNVFDEFVKRLNSEISKAVLGQDGTTDNKDATGTFGSLKVLQGVANDRHEADKTMVKNNVNDELLPRLTTYFNYNFTGHTFEWSTTEDMDTKDFIQAVKDLGTVFELDPKQITEKTGINILGQKQADPLPSPKPVAVQKKKHSPVALTIFRPEYPDFQGPPVAIDQSSLQLIETQVLEEIFGGRKVFSPGYFYYLSSELSRAFEASWKTIPFTYSDIDHSVLSMMEASCFRFSAAKDLAMVQELNEILRNSSTFENFKQNAAPVLGNYNGNYLRTEYDNAVSSGINAARYRSQVEDMDVLPYWQYQTAGDARVREAHQVLDNLIMKADDPAWSRIYPPNGWNCRCEVIPLGDLPRGMELTDGDDAIGKLQGFGLDKNGNSEWDRMVKSGFDINRGDLGQVFTENQMYAREFDARMGVKDFYGDKDHSWSKLDKSAFTGRTPHLQSNDQAHTWINTLRGENKFARFEDHKGRPTRLTVDTFTKHVNDKPAYKDRFRIAEFVPDILKSPDEIWLEGEGGKTGFTFFYVKFYNEDLIVVVVEAFATEPMKIKTFINMSNDNYRRGLLIKKHTG